MPKTYSGYPMTWTVIDSTVTAIGKFWRSHCLHWDRKEWQYLALIKKGLQKTIPSKTYETRPITWKLLGPVLRDILAKSRDVLTLTTAAAALSAYMFGNRSGEYTSDTASIDDGAVMFQLKHLQFIPDGNGGVKSVVFRIPKSKCNQLGEKFEAVEAPCLCHHNTDVMCLPHLYLELFALRQKRGEILRNSSPVLVVDGLPMRQQHINHFAKQVAVFHGLDPELYRAHSFRSGRATDLANAGVPAYIIKKWGRWLSDCWEKHYAKMNHSDIAKVTHAFLHKHTVALTKALVDNHN